MFGSLKSMEFSKTIRENNNFDLLRLLMASAVFFVHVETLTGIENFDFFLIFFNSSIAVYCFFIISGFLIFMSYEKSSTLKSYTEKRIRRIVPAYVMVVLVCAFGGAFLTTLSSGDYFSSPSWFKYLFANLLTLNFLEPSLPGVFSSNGISAVNGALWTIKIEVMFYFSVPILVYLFNRFNRLAVIAVIYLLSVAYYLGLVNMYNETGIKLYMQFAYLLPGSFSFFISGGLLYYYLDVFKKRCHLYFAFAVIGYLISKYAGFYLLLPISLSVIVIYCAVLTPYLGNAAHFGDFSYGIYIWHFPVVQTLIALGFFAAPWLGFAMAVALILSLSGLSWHFVERPTLNKSSHYVLARLQP